MNKPLLTQLAAVEATKELRYVETQVGKATRFLRMEHAEPHETPTHEQLLKILKYTQDLLDSTEESMEKTFQWLKAIEE